MRIIQSGVDLRSDALDQLGIVTGTSGNDILSGGSGADIIKGLGGDDQVSAFEGDDKVYGGTGDDTLHGGAGDDLLDGGKGSDQLESASGDDTLRGGDGDDRLGCFDSDNQFDFGGDKMFDGGAGIDTVYFEDKSEVGVSISLALAGEVQDSGRGDYVLIGIENIAGTSFADNLSGDDGANLVIAGGGADTIDGGGGDDGLFIALGGDPIHAAGGDGGDTAIFDNAFSGADSFTIDLHSKTEQDTGAGLVSLRSIENVSTGAVDDTTPDTLIGDNHGNQLAGSGGDDHLIGNGGADLLLGDGYIGTEADVENGNTLHVDLGGFGSGRDTLEGGAGADTLVGGSGRDELVGGGGKDSFVFLSPTDSTVSQPDMIDDLDRHDRIDLSAIDADVNTAGDQAFHIVRTFTGVAGQLTREYDPGAGVTDFLLDLNGDGHEDMDIQVLGDAHTFKGFVL